MLLLRCGGSRCGLHVLRRLSLKHLAFRMQIAAKFVVVCLMFGTALPLLYGFAALYFAVSGYVDRYNFLRNMVPPPRTSAKLTVSAHATVFPIGIVAHAVMARGTHRVFPLHFPSVHSC